VTKVVHAGSSMEMSRRRGAMCNARSKYLNFYIVLNPLATSGPKVCPAGSSERVKVMSNVVNSVLAPTVAPTKVDVPTSAPSVDTSTAAPAKEAFTNSAGAGAKSTVSEHAVGAVPVMVGQVVAPVLDCDWRRRPFVGTWYRPPDELPSAALPVIVPEHLKVLSLPSNPALQCLFTGSLNMPSERIPSASLSGLGRASGQFCERLVRDPDTNCLRSCLQAIPESQWAAKRERWRCPLRDLKAAEDGSGTSLKHNEVYDARLCQGCVRLSCILSSCWLVMVMFLLLSDLQNRSRASSQVPGITMAAGVPVKKISVPTTSS
ncbi:unnamed protein product, partial [Symbiodinium microadriaticum]